MFVRYQLVFLLILTLGLGLTACQSSGPEVSELGPLDTPLILEPEGEGSADPAAAGGEAALLFRTNERARFTADVASGTYEVSVVARGQAYAGDPAMRLLVGGQQVGEDVFVQTVSYKEHTFGEVDLEAGQIIEVVFTNDKWDGSPEKDRNLYIDYLILSRVGDVDSAPAPDAPEDINVEYPAGTPGVYNVQDFGAKGDGVTDDTAAILATFEAIDNVPYSRPKADFSTVYLPDGTYLVSDTISFERFRTLQGQSEAGTVIKLMDNAPGYSDPASPNPVVRCKFSNNESFGNYVRNLTIDTGRGNPGASGLRYNTHNNGLIEYVTLRSGDGSGVTGLDLQETEFGPGLIKNLSIEGFDVGIRTPGTPSHGTFAHITLRNQNVAGIENFLPISVQDLRSDNSVPAIINGDGNPTAHMVLVGADLRGGSPDQVAIQNEGTIYLANVNTSGYKAALKNKGGLIYGPIDTFAEGEAYALFGATPDEQLDLPLESAPPIFYEPASSWVTPVNTAGDDTAAIQAAIDSGAQTIFFPYDSAYEISDTLIVRGNVRRLLGMNKSILNGDLATFSDKPIIRVEGNGAQPVSIEYLNTGSYPDKGHWALELASADPVYIKGAFEDYFGGYISNSAQATGKLFIDEGLSSLSLNFPQTVQIRQYNTENNPYEPGTSQPVTYVENNGAELAVLGWKTEAPAVHAVTTNGGKTAVLGGFFRDFFDIEGVPYFGTQDAQLTASYYQYASGCGDTRTLHATETRQGETRELALSPNCSRGVALYSAGD